MVPAGKNSRRENGGQIVGVHPKTETSKLVTVRPARSFHDTIPAIHVDELQLSHYQGSLGHHVFEEGANEREFAEYLAARFRLHGRSPCDDTDRRSGFTLVHALQERKGQLWRYFGAVAGVKIPDGFGLAVFFVTLTISLWFVGLLGITGAVLWQTPLAFGCLGAIVGCRLSDSVFSHILLNNEGYRPNPGLPSVPLYFLESLALVVVFYPTMRMHILPAVIGFIIGAVFFYSVIPSLRTLGRSVFEPIEPWHKGGPQPKW